MKMFRNIIATFSSFSRQLTEMSSGGDIKALFPCARGGGARGATSWKSRPPRASPVPPVTGNPGMSPRWQPHYSDNRGAGGKHFRCVPVMLWCAFQPRATCTVTTATHRSSGAPVVCVDGAYLTHPAPQCPPPWFHAGPTVPCEVFQRLQVEVLICDPVFSQFGSWFVGFAGFWFTSSGVLDQLRPFVRCFLVGGVCSCSVFSGESVGTFVPVELLRVFPG